METRRRTLENQVRKVVFAAGLAAAAATASLALADGGPKNAGLPSAGLAASGRSKTQLTPTMSVMLQAGDVIEGEAKNEPPFTDPANITDGLARFLRNSQPRTTEPSGETKSEPPFTTTIGGVNSPTAQAFGSSYGALPS